MVTNTKIVVKLHKNRVDDLFEDCDDQSQVIEKLYEMVIIGGSLREVAKFTDYPKCNSWTSQYIFQKFIEFDRIAHPNSFAGGGWLNWGWSTLQTEHLQNWEVQVDPEAMILVNELFKPAEIRKAQGLSQREIIDSGIIDTDRINSHTYQKNEIEYLAHLLYAVANKII